MLGSRSPAVDKFDGYRPRIVDTQIAENLELSGAVLLTGPEHCGKTVTAEKVVKSGIYLQHRENSEKYLEIAKIKVSDLLEGENPRLIDEWQTAPNVWGAIRFDVGHRKDMGLYVLTGSVKTNADTAKHPGTGRISDIRMRTMSLYESGDSTGEISLSGLFGGQQSVSGCSERNLSDIAGLIVRGGWPKAVAENTGDDTVSGYCESFLGSGIHIDGKRFDKRRMKTVLRSLSESPIPKYSKT